MTKPKFLLTATYIVGPALLVGVVALLFTNSLQYNDSVASVTSALATLLTLFVNVVRHLRRDNAPLDIEAAATQLTAALREQWEPEMRHRKERFGDSRTIPLTWVQVDPHLAEAPTQRVPGRLDENIDEAAEQLAHDFRQLPGSQRLLLLGEPGAGKTFLAIALTVGLLRRWSAGQRVPVFLSMSSWDPVIESLDAWMVREIASLYYGGRKHTPRTLLNLRHLLPVLDGLDELPEHVRRLAITRINHTLDGDRSLVLTCRTAEYLDEIAGGAPVLMRAAVVQVQPLGADDIAAHLSGTPAWSDVVQQVKLRPESPLAMALSTPLMLSLFTAVYSNCGPAELVENQRLDTRHAIEDFLVDALLDSAYPTDASHGPWWTRRWTAKRARKWLTYLAEHLHEHGGRDVSSGQLAHRVVTVPWMAGIGFAAILMISSLASRVMGLLGLEPHQLSDVPLLYVLVVGVYFASGVLAKQRRLPGRMPLDADRPREGFGFGMLAGTLGVLSVGFLVAVAALLSFKSHWDYEHVVSWSANVSVVIAMALVAGLGVGLHEARVARMFERRGARAGIADFLRRDRGSALRTALGTGLLVGLLTFFSATIAATIGGHLGQRVAMVIGLPTVADLHLPSLRTHVPWRPPPEGLTALVEMSVLLVVAFGLSMLVTRTWTRFLVARTVLAGLGLLPWRVERFLADARERGVLRGAGGYYQFGHIRLQERLIATAVADRSRKSRRAWRLGAAGVAGTVVLTAVALLAAAEPAGCRPTGVPGLDHRMARPVEGEVSGCFGYLTRDEWHVLAKTEPDSALLTQIGSVHPVPDDSVEPNVYDHVFIVGQFDTVDPGRLHDILEGVATAQRVHKVPIEIDFVFAYALPANQDTEAASLTSTYVRAALERMVPGGHAGTRLISASVNFNISPTAVMDWNNEVVGLREADVGKLREISDEYRTLTVSNWTYRYGRDYAAIPDDKISDEECSRIIESSPSTWQAFDLRQLSDPLRLIERLASCKGDATLIDSRAADTVRARPDLLSKIGVDYLKDESATMEHDCERYLSNETQSRAVASCMATLAAADSFRISIVKANGPS